MSEPAASKPSLWTPPSPPIPNLAKTSEQLKAKQDAEVGQPKKVEEEAGLTETNKTPTDQYTLD